MSCDCNVTCLFIVTKRKKKKKRNIKSRKIDKRKRKMLVFKVFYNTTVIWSMMCTQYWRHSRLL